MLRRSEKRTRRRRGPRGLVSIRILVQRGSLAGNQDKLSRRRQKRLLLFRNKIQKNQYQVKMRK
jgi:hypothetical protein